MEFGWEKRFQKNLSWGGSFHVRVISTDLESLLATGGPSNYSLSVTLLPAHPLTSVLLTLPLQGWELVDEGAGNFAEKAISRSAIPRNFALCVR